MFDFSGFELLPSTGPVDKSILPNCSMLQIAADDFDQEFTQEMRNLVAESPAALDLLADSDDLSGLLDDLSQNAAHAAVSQDLTLLQKTYDFAASTPASVGITPFRHFQIDVPSVSSCSGTPQRNMLRFASQEFAPVLLTCSSQPETRTTGDVKQDHDEGELETVAAVTISEHVNEPCRRQEKIKDGSKSTKQHSEKTLRKQLQEFVHKSNQFAPEADLRFAIDNMVRAWKEVQAYGINPQEVLSQLPDVSSDACVAREQPISSESMSLTRCRVPSTDRAQPPAENTATSSACQQHQQHQQHQQQQQQQQQQCHLTAPTVLPRHRSEPHLHWLRNTSPACEHVPLHTSDHQHSYFFQGSFLHGDDASVFQRQQPSIVNGSFTSGTPLDSPAVKQSDQDFCRQDMCFSPYVPCQQFQKHSRPIKTIPYMQGFATACHSAMANLTACEVVEETHNSHPKADTPASCGSLPSIMTAVGPRPRAPFNTMRRFSFSEPSCQMQRASAQGVAIGEFPDIPAVSMQLASAFDYCTATQEPAYHSTQQEFWPEPKSSMLPANADFKAVGICLAKEDKSKIDTDPHGSQKPSPSVSEASSDDGHEDAMYEYDDDSSDRMSLRSHLNMPKRDIDLDQLRQVYEFPINEAAKRLGVGVTVLKKYCRKYDIPRWPYRKLKSMDKLIESVIDYSSQDPQTSEAVLKELRTFREIIYHQPSIDLESRIKKLRQANFKLEYKQRLAKTQETPNELLDVHCVQQVSHVDMVTPSSDKFYQVPES